MTTHLLAADPNRRPPRNGDERPRCASCTATARRCDTAKVAALDAVLRRL